MASDHSREPAFPGLSSQVADTTERFGAFVAVLDPDTLTGPDAVSLYEALCHLGRLVEGGKTLLAPRIESSRHWEATGHPSAAALLAELEGTTPGQARRTLVTGRQLTGLPSVEGALRAGELSGAKAAEIAGAASVDPAAEGALLAGAGDEDLATVRQRCARIRATAPGRDPMARARKIHADRYFTHRIDDDGAFCFSGRDTAERGAALLARLLPAADRLAAAKRQEAAKRQAEPDRHAAANRPAAAGRAAGAASGPSGDPPVTSRGAHLVDALMALVTAGSDGGGQGGDGGGAGDEGGDGRHSSGPSDSTDPINPVEVVRGTPPATILVRVDRDALLRGHALPGERCEIDGVGPVPVPVARTLCVDSFLAVVVTEADDIRSVVHLGRTINASLRTALVFRDRCCVVPGCTSTRNLEIDHVRPLELGGPTALDNLATLCRHHHRKKTYEGWVLERHGPSDADPQWSFTPLPEFGQEPDLGADRGKELDHGPVRDRDPAPTSGKAHPPDDATLFDRLPEVVPRR